MSDNTGIINEYVAETIAPGQVVYDNVGKVVGSVDFTDTEHGYATVLTNPFSEEAVYIPFRLITNIDPQELYLSLPKEELDRDHRTPPPRSTTVERVSGTTVATTSEPSGYDGRRVVVDQVRLDELRLQIAVGDRVYTSELTDLGTIKQYDPVTGWMLVEKRVIPKHDLMLPVTIVGDVDRLTQEVYLTVSESDLRRMQRAEPANVVFVDAQVRETS
jgi:hypothetical protein